MSRRLIPALALAVGMLGVSSSSSARHTHDHTEESPAALAHMTASPRLTPNQIAIDVHGVVCSICAYGLEKRLSKLPFIDRSHFKNGVQTNIDEHLVTLAIDPAKPVDLRAIHRAITDGGYKPVTMYLHLAGTLTRDGDTARLQTSTGNAFELRGPEAESLQAGPEVQVTARLDASRIPGLTEGAPVPVDVLRPESP
jgi:hypothetical protein